jgi:hypothetical protein
MITLTSVRRSVGSRTGAVFLRFSLSVAPRFLWECLTSRTVNPYPVPATSNPACEFLALGFPVHFLPRVMRPIAPGRLAAVALVDALGSC